MFSYSFDHPWLLIGILIVVPIYLYLLLTGRKRSLIPYPPIQYQQAKLFPKLLFGIFSALEVFLLIFIFFSLAKPYNSTEITSIEEDGIDVALVIDVSASMQANDFDPNRLEATKKIVKDFVRRSGGNRIGLIVFGKHVFTLSPLTTDHLVLSDLIDNITLNTIDHYRSGGTAIGDALLRAADILQGLKIEGRAQVLILLTDGDNNEGIEPKKATKFAVSHDIKIHTIGLGATTPVEVQPFPVKDPKWTFSTKLVEEPLKEIAVQAGGQYFHASNDAVLIEIFNELSRLERTPLEVDRVSQKKYKSADFNIIIACLFVTALLLKVIFLRRPLK